MSSLFRKESSILLDHIPTDACIAVNDLNMAGGTVANHAWSVKIVFRWIDHFFHHENGKIILNEFEKLTFSVVVDLDFVSISKLEANFFIVLEFTKTVQAVLVVRNHEKSMTRVLVIFKLIVFVLDIIEKAHSKTDRTTRSSSYKGPTH